MDSKIRKRERREMALDVVSCYKDGMELEDIAERLCVTRWYLDRLLVEFGFDLRKIHKRRK